jgi:hypothetical protein
MDVKVRGVDATLTVDPVNAGLVLLHMKIEGIKSEEEALKKMKEWGFIKADKRNTGKPAQTPFETTTSGSVQPPMDVTANMEVKRE